MDSVALNSGPGAAIYSSLVLKIYDAWVLGLSNSFAWGCPTDEVLLPFYRQHVGGRHLDVGVGTGYYLHHMPAAAQRRVTLFDLNANSLRAAAGRMRQRPEAMISGDILAPGEALKGREFDSIALFYLLHCLPGTMTQKESVFAHLKHSLSADGVLYGATILGDAAGHNGFGGYLMKVYNKKGIFGNAQDTLEGLSAALERHFAEVRLTQHGRVVLFAARGAIGG